MGDLIKLLNSFVDATALILALVLIVNILHRTGHAGWLHTLLMGAVFSLGVFFTMSDPISLGAAGIFDMRGLLIGCAVALFGPVSGLMALVTGLGMRFSIGEPGLTAGIIGMLCAYGAGLLWRIAVKQTAIATWKKSVSLGGMITFQLLAIFAAPIDLWGPLFFALVPYTLVSNVAGALVVNHLISGELSFLSEAETSKVEATTDHLTGLLNRRGLELIYPDLTAQNGTPKSHALLYFDIDKFKIFNDTFGHALGDDVLKFITEKVSCNLRPHDVFARLGGDEFAVVLGRVDADEASRIAERCRAAVADGRFEYERRVLRITVSVGAFWTLEHTEIDQILDAADKALYVAKSEGRNKVVFNGNHISANADFAA